MNNQLYKPTNQNSLKVPKLLTQRIRKRRYKTLGTNNFILAKKTLYHLLKAFSTFRNNEAYLEQNVQTLLFDLDIIIMDLKGKDNKLKYIPNDDTQNYPFLWITIGF